MLLAIEGNKHHIPRHAYLLLFRRGGGSQAPPAIERMCDLLTRLSHFLRTLPAKTMIIISIGHCSRTIKDFTPAWLREQLDARRNAGEPGVVRVTIKTGCADIALATPGAARGGGSTRSPNHREREIFDLWEKRGLNNANFLVGQLIAFLNQVKSWC